MKTTIVTRDNLASKEKQNEKPSICSDCKNKNEPVTDYPCRYCKHIYVDDCGYEDKKEGIN